MSNKKNMPIDQRSYYILSGMERIFYDKLRKAKFHGNQEKIELLRQKIQSIKERRKATEYYRNHIQPLQLAGKLKKPKELQNDAGLMV